jgi:hypothetical protein
MGCAASREDTKAPKNTIAAAGHFEIKEPSKQKFDQVQSVSDFEKIANKTKTEMGIQTDSVPEEVKQKEELTISKPNEIVNVNLLLENVISFRLPKGFICIALEILKDTTKNLKAFISMIRFHRNLNFVFLGDIADNISARCDQFSQNFRCIELLFDFFDKPENDFQSPSDFQRISFAPSEFKADKTVQFVAGNAEVDILKDLQQNYTHQNNQYIFGKGKYQKRFILHQLYLIYRFLTSCSSELTYRKDRKTVHFRHAANKTFETSPSGNFIEASVDHPVICGHNHNVGTKTVANQEITTVMLDTCENQWDARCGVISVENGQLSALGLSPLLLLSGLPPKQPQRNQRSARPYTQNQHNGCLQYFPPSNTSV